MLSAHPTEPNLEAQRPEPGPYVHVCVCESECTPQLRRSYRVTELNGGVVDLRGECHKISSSDLFETCVPKLDFYVTARGRHLGDCIISLPHLGMTAPLS